MDKIRNFGIIAHIDHGKSTLADRLLEITWVIDKLQKWQVLDKMDLEQERGITIKLAPARMNWKGYQLNLIDTPWHVDFQYEVSRSLAAVEGVLLLVDATQWVQAQTLSTLYMAVDYGLEIIPVINKIDLPAAHTDRVITEFGYILWVDKSDIIQISAKTWQNVDKVLDAIITHIPGPDISLSKSSIIQPSIWRALIFDSVYDPYRWVVVYVKSINWAFKKNDTLKLVFSKSSMVVQEVGCFSPDYKPEKLLDKWEIWYIVTWLKSVRDAQIWDTILVTKRDENNEYYKPTYIKNLSIPGFKLIQPFVYSWVFPTDTSEYEKLRDSLEKFSLNDSAIVYDYENSRAFGFGFRCGFLWMLHMDIVKERLVREHNIETIFTIPNVVYIIKLKCFDLEKVKSWENINELKDTWLWHEIVNVTYKWKVKNSELISRFKLENEFIVDKNWEYEKISLWNYLIVRSWWEMPDAWFIDAVYEPYVSIEIVWPNEYSWNIMTLLQDYRGEMRNMEYIDADRLVWKYFIPLWEIIIDFHDRLKSVSKWYASMNYEKDTYRRSDLVRLDIHINMELVSAFSIVIDKGKAFFRWRDITQKLKELIPKHMFTIPIQAVIWNKPIARQTISALRKDVIAKLYGGDVTRKKKLLAKQKEWKKRLKSIWKVNVPSDIFIKMMQRE